MSLLHVKWEKTNKQPFKHRQRINCDFIEPLWIGQNLTRSSPSLPKQGNWTVRGQHDAFFSFFLSVSVCLSLFRVLLLGSCIECWLLSGEFSVRSCEAQHCADDVTWWSKPLSTVLDAQITSNSVRSPTVTLQFFTLWDRETLYCFSINPQ